MSSIRTGGQLCYRARVASEPKEATTVEDWAEAYVLADSFDAKLAPPACPKVFARDVLATRLTSPGRGVQFRCSPSGIKNLKSTGKSPLAGDLRRLRLIHTFLHHELQAAELFAWAILAFPRAPEAMRRGFLTILHEEIRHMNLYADLLRSRGIALGDFPVRDWFWERVPLAPDELAFIATLGIGFEGGNLDHATRFASRFEAAGDLEAARVQTIVGREEVGHVRFALRWFRELSPELARGATLFDAFRAVLPAPLTPILMRGVPLDEPSRKRAGFDAEFLDALAIYA